MGLKTRVAKRRELHHGVRVVAATAARTKLAAATNGAVTREDEIRRGRHLLEQRCAFIGARILPMQEDGNCQFRAAAKELFGDQRFHELVRESVVNQLTKHAPVYSPIFGGETEEWDSYLNGMAQPRTWGDELTLRSIADAFGVHVHLITSSNEHWYLVYNPNPGLCAGVPCNRRLFLSYIAPIHYDVLAPA